MSFREDRVQLDGALQSRFGRRPLAELRLRCPEANVSLDGDRI